MVRVQRCTVDKLHIAFGDVEQGLRYGDKNGNRFQMTVKCTKVDHIIQSI